MSKVVYTLLYKNRKVTVKYGDLTQDMPLRDFLKLVEAYDCEVSNDNSVVIGPSLLLDIEVELIDSEPPIQ